MVIDYKVQIFFLNLFELVLFLFQLYQHKFIRMKYFGLVLFFGAMFSLNAQNFSQNAIGLRIGDNNGFGTEISYQRALSDINRLEIDLGWRSGENFDGFQLTGLYQWVWQLDGQFNWFAGAGAGGGVANNIGDGDDSDTFLFAAGVVGIEYQFNIPLQVAVDTRPVIGFSDFNDDLSFDIALSVRYNF